MNELHWVGSNLVHHRYIVHGTWCCSPLSPQDIPTICFFFFCGENRMKDYSWKSTKWFSFLSDESTSPPLKTKSQTKCKVYLILYNCHWQTFCDSVSVLRSVFDALTSEDYVKVLCGPVMLARNTFSSDWRYGIASFSTTSCLVCKTFLSK